jgi:GLPGLI family protein
MQIKTITIVLFVFIQGIFNLSFAQQKGYVFKYNMWIDRNKSPVPKNPYKMYIANAKALQVSSPNVAPLPKDVTTEASSVSYSSKRLKVEEPFLYWDLKTNEMVSKQWVITEEHIVLDKLSKIDWIISKEKKKVSSFLCQKATAKIRGRKYTAWFAPEIPISAGPWKLGGLPGLILEAEDDTHEIEFEFVSFSFNAPIIYAIEPIKAKRTSVTTINASQIPALRSKILQNIKKMDTQAASKFEGSMVTSSITISGEVELFENEVKEKQ